MSISAIIVADRHRLLTRSAQTLLGICSGLIADGDLNDAEISFLQTWLLENQDIVSVWPGSVIADRIKSSIANGNISETDRSDLLATLRELTGTNFSETGSAQADSPANLPVDDAVNVNFADMQFCFSGKFIYGTRETCHRTTNALGGIVAQNVAHDLDYLVIGSLIKRDWAYESYGRKIEKAAQLRQANGRPAIISEAHWTAAVKQALT